MCALLRHPAVLQDENAVRLHEGGDPVGDDEGGDPLPPGPKGVPDGGVRAGVHGGEGVVEDEDVVISRQGPGDGHPLLLAAGEGDAPLADHGIIALLEVQDVLVDAGVLRRGLC